MVIRSIRIERSQCSTGEPVSECSTLRRSSCRCKAPHRSLEGRAQVALVLGWTVVRTYHVGLGLTPEGDKVRSGDHRTPEGEFYVFTKNPKSAFYLSLGISYPNVEHARRGLRDGLISTRPIRPIVEANKRKQTPPQNTKLGGSIYIHGNGSRTDWTWGCVALENEEVKELYEAVRSARRSALSPDCQ